jgi:LysR family pca operon transcriptional activator
MTVRHLDQRFRLHALRAIDAIETQLSLVKASAALGISQPSLTKALHDVEAMLEVRLFDRHPRGMRPTVAGTAVARAARRVLAELRRLEAELDQLASPGAGTVSLGALPVAATGVLPGVLSRLARTHPDIKIGLQQGRTEELLPTLAAGEIDLIVGRLYEPAMPDGFVREALWAEPLSILARAGHPVTRDGPPSVKMLREYALVLPTVTQRVGQEIEHLLFVLGLDAAASLRSSSYGLIREMLHDTDRLSIMPRMMMVGDLLRGTLQVVALPIEAPPRPAGLITAAGRVLPPACRTFVECLRAYIAEITARGI